MIQRKKDSNLMNMFYHFEDILNPISAIKVLKNRIVLIMRVNPDVRIVSAFA